MITELDYKKRLKQHRKSTKGHQTDESTWTAFRREEKKYKAKYPPPSLDEVLDLAALLDDKDQVGNCSGSTFIRRLKSKPGQPLAFSLDDIPGLVLIPRAIPAETQKNLIRAALLDYSRLNETNLHAHYMVPPSGIWKLHESGDPQLILPKSSQVQADVQYEIENKGPRRRVENQEASLEDLAGMMADTKLNQAPSTSVKPSSATDLLPRLRWTNLGHFYHWGSKSYDLSKHPPPVPSEVRNLCKNLVAGIEWDSLWPTDYDPQDTLGLSSAEWNSWGETYDPDAGIVNFYQLQDTLMGHVDRSEMSSTTPLVSISLGRPAIFLIGGKNRNVRPTPILLRSGDVVILAGGCRRAFHGVPRILENHEVPTFLTGQDGPNWRPFANYIRNTRININVRQVFPAGHSLPGR